MGRRRKKVVRVVRRTLPEYFLCPRCGKNTVKISTDKKREVTFVVCGTCGLRCEYPLSRPMEPVDIYCTFVDRFYAKP
ncbi:MAG: hypothetical protein ACETVR_04185 [Candidatus Bathyarchaeia archaeon]